MFEIQIFVLILLLILSGVFSGIETALMSTNLVKVRSLLKQQRKGSEALFRIKQNPHRLIITILIGNNLVNIGAASLATVVFTDLFGSAGVGIATGIMTFLILVFGEITPKTLARQNAQNISLLVAGPIERLSKIIGPIISVFEVISKFMMRLFGSKEESGLSEEELKTIVTMGAEQGILDKESAEMMHNILSFKGTYVTRVMTPKVSMKMVPGSVPLRDVLEFVTKKPYSRYPVYVRDENHIVGILDVDDVLVKIRDHKLDVLVKDIARKPFFIPVTKEIDDLLFEFEEKQVPMAIIVDEYGNVDGLITLDDILEEIVGNIFDKSKRESIYFHRVNDRVLKVDARATVEEVNRILHLGLKAEHFDTIAGFVEHKLQKIPKKGEKVDLKNVILEVDKVTDQKIDQVLIFKK